MVMMGFSALNLVKGIATCMKNIDAIAERMMEVFSAEPGFPAVVPRISSLARAFDFWSDFVTASEAIEQFVPTAGSSLRSTTRLRVGSGTRLLRRGKEILNYLARARVPMPKTTATYLEVCNRFAAGKGETEILSLGKV